MTNNSGYFPVSADSIYSLKTGGDNGLGFGQGSTAGIYNQYYRGGFHRPHVPQQYGIDSRRMFNLKGHKGNLKCDSYSCHYDPEWPGYSNCVVNIQNKDIQHINAKPKNFDSLNTIVLLIISVIFLFFMYCFF